MDRMVRSLADAMREPVVIDHQPITLGVNIGVGISQRTPPISPRCKSSQIAGCTLANAPTVLRLDEVFSFESHCAPLAYFGFPPMSIGLPLDRKVR